MNKIYLIFFSLIISHIGGWAQKRALNYSDLDSWPEILAQQVSNNGKFVVYTIHSGICGDSVFIKKLDDSPVKAFPIAGAPLVTQDSRHVIFIMPGDSLCTIDPSTGEQKFWTGILSFKIPEIGNGRWMACLIKSNEVLIVDFNSGNEEKYQCVGDYLFDKEGKVLLWSGKNRYQWMDLGGGKPNVICAGTGLEGFQFDNSGDQIVFFVEDTNKVGVENQIWYYKRGMDSAKVLVSREVGELEQGFTIAKDYLHFSPDGQRLFFNIRQVPPVAQPNGENASVDIWNYKDEFLQTDQMIRLEAIRNRAYRAVVTFNEKKTLRLEKENDQIVYASTDLNEGGGDNYLLTKTRLNDNEGYRLKSERPDIFLIDTRNGVRKCIKSLTEDYVLPAFSPSGKFVYWYDPITASYFTYNIHTGLTKNISKGSNQLFFEKNPESAQKHGAFGMAAWLKEDEAIFVYDHYDIWRLDPEGKKLPTNLTNGYGRKHRISIRFVYQEGSSNNPVLGPPFDRNYNALLCGFDEENKNNVFFSKKLDAIGDPLKLCSVRGFIYYPNAMYSFGIDFNVIKAKDTNVFLIRKMNASAFPNLEVTSNFSDFRPITNFEPQKKVNWLTDELVRWKTFDGQTGQGILYKPEDFNPKIKYPVIFYVYSQLTGTLNNFILPEYSDGLLNIPWFVSHGYLVFCPDIHYVVGAPGESTYNYVVSAAEYLKAFPWIDSGRMGIQGHSWGGYEVNYLVTRTRIFAAAASAAGPADWVSEYGSLAFSQSDIHWYLERGQPRLGLTLWESPRVYIENSPVFRADKVVTPLLIMHNKKDGAVPWTQGVEFFTDLRRLGKKVWMLQYDHSQHVLITENDQKDYSIRLQQFFDHFLKGIAAPKWMTEGVRAIDKGINTGLDLDMSGAVP